ncbi:MAG: hypothetical protein AAI978_00055 [Candidatus Hodgkinia cicadicola]
MLDSKRYKHRILSALARKCAWQVVELGLPTAVPAKMLKGWHSRYWGMETALGYRVCYLFQPVACYYLSLCPLDSVGVYFGEHYIKFRFVPYIGLLAKDDVCWSSWTKCLVATWNTICCLAPINTDFNGVLKISLREVYNNYVDACGFSVFVTKVLKSCFGNFEALKATLAALSANAVNSNKRQFYAVDNKYYTRLVYFYSLICNEVNANYCKQRVADFAKLKLLKCAGFVPTYKLDLFKKLLSLDLDITSTLNLFNNVPRYTKAWMVLKRFRDCLSDLDIEVRHVCWLCESAKTKSDLLFQFSSNVANAIGESYKHGFGVVTSSIVDCSG